MEARHHPDNMTGSNAANANISSLYVIFICNVRNKGLIILRYGEKPNIIYSHFRYRANYYIFSII